MVATSTLVLALCVIVITALVLRVILWRLVRAAVTGAPLVVPRLSGSRLWRSGAPYRASASARYPRLFGWLAARFSLAGFAGLPLTLIVVAGLYLLAMLGGLVDDVRENEGMVRLDQSVDAFFTPYRANWMLKGFLWITEIGAGPCLAAVLCVSTALLWSSRRTNDIWPIWVSFFGAQATTWSSKYIIARPRPEFLPHITEWNPSFPSGHATASTALIGMLGYVVARGVPGLRGRFEVGFWTACLVAVICFSRLFLGVHFFTDVMAGIMVGLFWLLVGFTVAELRAPNLRVLRPAVERERDQPPQMGAGPI